MSITDTQFKNLTNEVRILQGSQFTQIPNFVEAAEDMANGQFVAYDDNGKFSLASATRAATHLALKSGNHRITAREVALYAGLINEGEGILAITGLGTVEIPVATTVAKGDQLVVVEGYAHKRTMADAGYVIGYAMQDIVVEENQIENCQCFIELPAKYHNSNV